MSGDIVRSVDLYFSCNDEIWQVKNMSCFYEQRYAAVVGHTRSHITHE